MRNSLLVFAIGVVICVGAGCHQTYYSKLFRTQEARIGNGYSFSKELLDGRIGTFGNSDFLVRVVSVWDSNNKNRMASNSYSVSVLQRSRGALSDTMLIDSIDILFQPSGEHHMLPKYSMVVLDGYFVPSPRVKTKFCNIVIPPDINAIEIRFAARKQSELREEPAKEFSVALTRYEGAVEKFGHWEVD